MTIAAAIMMGMAAVTAAVAAAAIAALIRTAKPRRRSSGTLAAIMAVMRFPPEKALADGPQAAALRGTMGPVAFDALPLRYSMAAEGSRGEAVRPSVRGFDEGRPRLS